MPAQQTEQKTNLPNQGQNQANQGQGFNKGQEQLKKQNPDSQKNFNQGGQNQPERKEKIVPPGQPNKFNPEADADMDEDSI